MMSTIRTLAFAGLNVIALTGAAEASPIKPVSANQFAAVYQLQDRYDAFGQIAHYGHSGSIGRLNYGANPMHPEGPGNFSD